MNHTDNPSSGFVGLDLPDELAFTNFSLIYVSRTGFSRLFRATRYGRLHVLKALKPAYAGQEFFEQALRKEFNIGYGLEHPNICRTLGWESVEGLGHCIVMEYVDGVSLTAFMEQGLLTAELEEKFARQLCDALQYLHARQIVHRDLKPDNLMVTHNGHNLKLVDFGLSDSDYYDILKLPGGTRTYMAPETLKPGAKLDLRADLYSLGMTLADMLKHKPNRRLEQVASRCIRPRPEQRPASAADVTRALDQRRNPAWTWALGLAGTAMLGVALATALRLGTGTPAPATGSMTLPAYGNWSDASDCARILADERLRLHRAGEPIPSAPANRTADSLDLQRRIAQEMARAYPLSIQRQSALYADLLKHWQAEAARLYSSPTSTANRDQEADAR